MCVCASFQGCLCFGIIRFINIDKNQAWLGAKTEVDLEKTLSILSSQGHAWFGWQTEAYLLSPGVMCVMMRHVSRESQASWPSSQTTCHRPRQVAGVLRF